MTDTTTSITETPVANTTINSSDSLGHYHSNNPCPVCRKKEEEYHKKEQERLKRERDKWTKRCIVVSDCLNRLRIIPRITIAMYGILVWIMVGWFMALDVPTTQQMALVTTICGMAPIVFGFYMQGGISGKKSSDK